MAFSGPSLGGSHDDDDGPMPMADMNVTPLVDVMLVLLIIFMVAAPLMTTGVPVQLPKTTAQKVAQAKKPLEISIDKDGRPYLAKEELTADAILPRLRALAAQDPGQVMLVRGDRDVPYGKIMEVMGLVGQAGFTKVSLIAQSPGGALPASPAAAPAPASGTPQ